MVLAILEVIPHKTHIKTPNSLRDVQKRIHQIVMHPEKLETAKYGDMI